MPPLTGITTRTTRGGLFTSHRPGGSTVRFYGDFFISHMASECEWEGKPKPRISIQNYNLWCQWSHFVSIWFLGGCCSALALPLSSYLSTACNVVLCWMLVLHFLFLRRGILYFVFRPRTQVAFIALHCGNGWVHFEEKEKNRWYRACVVLFLYFSTQIKQFSYLSSFIGIFGDKPHVVLNFTMKVLRGWINPLRFGVLCPVINDKES